MADEFLEPDHDVPTEHDVDEAYGSRFLGVTDVGTRRFRSILVQVGKENVKDRDSGRMKKKIIVFFKNIDKPLALNVTNKNVLSDALGKAPVGWIGATVGISVDPNVTFGGKRTGGIRLRVLLPPPPAKPTAAAAPVPDPKPAPAATEWTEEKGDPGFNDPIPDFEPA